jgi:hypothetical protein
MSCGRPSVSAVRARLSTRRTGVAIALIVLGGLACALSVVGGVLAVASSEEFTTTQIAVLGTGLAAVCAGLSLLEVVRRFTVRHERLALAGFVTVVSLLTVWFQFQGLRDHQHRPPAGWVQIEQLDNHNQVLDGTVGDPWRYRLLSEWLTEGAIDALRALGVGRPVLVGFLGVRVVQNAAIFLLAWILYRRLGLGRRRAALGLALLAWGTTQSLYEANLAFNTYSDVGFYLAAAVLLLYGAWAWIVPLTALAALNRETAGLIPVMTMSMALPPGVRSPAGRRALTVGALSLVVFAVTYAAVRRAVGPAELILPHGKHPGSEMLAFNLGRAVTWENVLRLVNVTPLLALLAVRSWPVELRCMALAVVPAWIVIHLFGGVLAEARLLLVPYALVLVPGALFFGREQVVSGRWHMPRRAGP